jgi:hypothetical protein
VTALSGWQNFYVIVGSSAGALIGLQFVVITLIADVPVALSDARAVDAFATPTIVYFETVLLLAALLSVPWHGVGTAAVIWGILGLAGILYVVIVNRRLRTQTAYQPQFEDWLFHVLLPLAAYATIAIAAFAARSHLREALFGIAAAALLLLFIDIHNAWDAITYHVVVRREQQQARPRR